MIVRTVSQILSIIERARCSLGAEKQTQADLAAALTRGGIDFRREVRLAPGDIIDMLCAGGIGIECKIKGASRASIGRQLARYAASDKISALILASNVSMSLPPTIGGKPVYFVGLGRAWL